MNNALSLYKYFQVQHHGFEFPMLLEANVGISFDLPKTIILFLYFFKLNWLNS